MLLTSQYNVEILFSSSIIAECHLYISKYLKEVLKIDNSNSKAFYENDNQVSIFNYHYIMPKSLKSKLIIVPYDD